MSLTFFTQISNRFQTFRDSFERIPRFVDPFLGAVEDDVDSLISTGP